MKSFYTGLYLIVTNEVITDVQVTDPNGNSIPLPLQDYINRGVKPDWKSLPTQAEFNVS